MQNLQYSRVSSGLEFHDLKCLNKCPAERHKINQIKFLNKHGKHLASASILLVYYMYCIWAFGSFS